jgi:hypothetical protein
LLQKFVVPFDRFIQQAPHIEALDPNVGDKFGYALGPEQVYLRLPRAGNMDTGGFVIGGVDHKPVPVGAVDDDHGVTEPIRWVLQDFFLYHHELYFASASSPAHT